MTNRIIESIKAHITALETEIDGDYIAVLKDLQKHIDEVIAEYDAKQVASANAAAAESAKEVVGNASADTTASTDATVNSAAATDEAKAANDTTKA